MIRTEVNRKAQRTHDRRTNLCAAAIAVLALLLLAPAAQAAPPVTFAESGQRAGQIDAPSGVAVDQASGAVYVAEYENRRVSKFDAEGHFLLAFGFGVADGLSGTLQVCGPQADPSTTRCFPGTTPLEETLIDQMRPDSVAVDPASGDVYVVDGTSARVWKFSSAGEFQLLFGKNVNTTPGTPTPNLCTAADLEAPGAKCGPGATDSGPGEFFNSPQTVIVDAESHVWVGEVGRLLQFDSSGHYVSEAALPGGAEGRSFARDSAGDFYAIKGGEIEKQQVSLSGFAAGDTFRLGNLPAECSSSSTGPIEFGVEESMREALEGKCGSGNFFVLPVANPIIFALGKFADKDLDELTCEAVSGAGSCSVSTVIDGQPGEVVKLQASGSPIDTLTSLGPLYTGAPVTVTLDGADNLYVGEPAGPYRFKLFNPAGELVSQFGAGQVIGSPGGEGGKFSVANVIAVGQSAASLYSVSGDEDVGQIFDLPEPGPLPGNERAEDVLPTTATLAATLNPEGHSTTYFFEYGTDLSYGSTTPVQTLPGSGFEEEAVEAAIDHLLPETPYHFRLVATNHCNNAEPAEECTVQGEDNTFTTPPAVKIEAQWATDLAARTATLHGLLDPLGVPASWWVEYGTDTGYGTSTPERDLGSGFGAVSVSEDIAGLKPGTTYHYRFAARDERDGTTYTVHGADRTITTQVGGLGFELADSRAWEMVSPPEKYGALIKSPWSDQGGHLQASATGEALLYNSVGSVEVDPEGNRASEGSSTLARRGAGGAWRSKDLTLPHDAITPVSVGRGLEYKLFSPNLERALVEQHAPALLSPQASERTPYLRENTEPATYTPLLTGKEGFANVPPGTEFGGDPASTERPVHVVGASSQLDHVLLRSEVPLVEGAPALALYAWAGGQLRPVSVKPAAEGDALVKALAGSGSASVRHAISEDGSRAFWSTYTSESASALNALYVRDIGSQETVRLDVVQPGAFGSGGANPVFQGADPGGTAALFTDSRNLTADANQDGRDLYRCELKVEGGELGCELTDLTAQTVNPGESAEVQGLLSGMSEDATHVYFVARGVLDAEQNGQHESAVPGEPNLYLWREGAGVRFIATLSEADSRDWSGPSLKDSQVSAAASPGGRYLGFMSLRSLTGYDNRDADGDEPLEEVYRYDAVADELVCASCNPSGARPLGLRGGEKELSFEFDAQELWTGRAVAAVLPGATVASLEGISLYRTRGVHDNGRIFFNAADSLVPADSNGKGDVYQYEPLGTGDCSASSGGAAISLSVGGCVSLISSGTGEETSAFLDASEGGDDVFFYTTAQLSVTDEDHANDVYDARVDGEPATLPLNPECLGEACQPAAQAPNDATPASAAFRGEGNVKATPTRKRCANGKRAVKRKGKARCVPRKQRKANRDRRTGR